MKDARHLSFKFLPLEVSQAPNKLTEILVIKEAYFIVSPAFCHIISDIEKLDIILKIALWE